MMKEIDKHIDRYIEQEKQLKPNPFLVTRIMANLDNQSEKVSAWQRVAIGASIAAMIIIGIGIGNTYDRPQQHININDNAIENLALYNSSDHE